MDYTGTRREGSERSAFFEEVCSAIISKVHPEVRYNPRTGHPDDPNPADVVRNWRLGGYYLASYFLPTRKKRTPLELESCIQGMRQRLDEYEQELEESKLGQLNYFDVGASEKVEAQAEKLVKLATHPGTGSAEAAAAALGLIKKIGSSELALLSWERVRYFAKRFHQMEELFEMIRKENPLLFMYGAKDQIVRNRGGGDH